MMPIPYVRVAFGDLPERLKGESDDVSVPRGILTRLLDLYISCWDFDEDWYRATYADVKESIDQGVWASGWAHFRAIGYWEGRFAQEPVVDADWYINTYPDIAQAMVEGRVTSALDHFVRFGYQEGRLPHEPGLYPKWYAPRYVPSIDPSNADIEEMLSHFLKPGYHQLAVPAPPR